jgi:hypothetical protein
VKLYARYEQLDWPKLQLSVSSVDHVFRGLLNPHRSPESNEHPAVVTLHDDDDGGAGEGHTDSETHSPVPLCRQNTDRD